MKKWMSILLCCAMLLGMMQGAALASDGQQEKLVSVNYRRVENGLKVSATVTEAGRTKLAEDATLVITVKGAGELESASKKVSLKDGAFAAEFTLQAGTYAGLTVSYDGEAIWKGTDSITIEAPAAEVTPPAKIEQIPTKAPVATSEPEETAVPSSEPTPVPSSGEGEATPAPSNEASSTPGDEGEETPAPSVEGEATLSPGDEATPAPSNEATPAPEGTALPEGTVTPDLLLDVVGIDMLQQADTLMIDPALAMSLPLSITQVSGGSSTVDFSLSADPAQQIKVTLIRSDGTVIPYPQSVITAPNGTCKGKFIGLLHGSYTLQAEYILAPVTTVTAPVSVKAGLSVDPISNQSSLVRGMTGAYLEVIVETMFGDKFFTTTVKSDFRGAFYASLDKPQKAGQPIYVYVLFPNNEKIQEVYLAQKDGDISKYPNELRFGQYGSGVLEMQKRLNQLGYVVDENSQFDEKTLKAVLDFQRINYINTDGVAGPAMRGALFSVTAREYTTEDVGSAGTLRYGDEGYDVKALQVELRKLGYYSGSLSGLYRSGTEKAVRDFERNNNLPVDGIADRGMQAVLFSKAAKKASASSGSGTSATTAPKQTAEPTVAPTAIPASAYAIQVEREQPITTDLVFGAWDTLLEKSLSRGILRLETESAYSLIDPQTPGMLLRATYINAQGNTIPCRIRWISEEGNFIVRDDARQMLGEMPKAYTGLAGEDVYWSAVPFMDALAAANENGNSPYIGQDNMIFWLNKPVLSAQPDRQWRVQIEVLDAYVDTLVLDSAEIVLVQQADALMTLDEDALRTEGWKLTSIQPEEDATDAK